MDQKSAQSLWSFLWAAIKLHGHCFLWFALLPCAWVFDQVWFPYCTKVIIDTVVNFTGNKQEIYSYLAPILYKGLLAWVGVILAWKILDIIDVYLLPKFEGEIRLNTFIYIQKHSARFFSNQKAGSIGTKISDLSTESWQLLCFIFKDLMPALVSILASIALLGTISPVFSMIFSIYFMTHMAICGLLGKKSRVLSDIHSQKKSDLYGNIMDSLHNMTSVRLFARTTYEQEYIERFQQSKMISHKSLLWSLFSMRMVLEGPALFIMCGSVYFLIHQWQYGVISPGDFAFVITLAFNTITSVWRLGTQLPVFFTRIGTCDQALAVIRLPHEIIDASHALDLKIDQAEIIFKDVAFSYEKQQQLFSNMNVIIHFGEKVGLVGYSGSGKSTFVHLILRYYDLESGQILINGQDIANVTQHSLQECIALVPQDISLFHRTIMENIKYGNIHASDAEVIEASKKAYCHEFISQLEDGYTTMVGEKGTKLSSGQRQRISIARALLKKAPIVILDEATSALDSVTEKYIHASLNQLMKGRTSIVIAHRLSTLITMDKILVFDGGKIIEQGSHKSLLEQNGHYATLWKMQEAGILPEV